MSWGKRFLDITAKGGLVLADTVLEFASMFVGDVIKKNIKKAAFDYDQKQEIARAFDDAEQYYQMAFGNPPKSPSDVEKVRASEEYDKIRSQASNLMRKSFANRHELQKSVNKNRTNRDKAAADYEAAIGQYEKELDSYNKGITLAGLAADRQLQNANREKTLTDLYEDQNKKGN